MARKSKVNTKGLDALGLGSLILSTAIIGFLLTTSVVTSGFFAAVNHLRPAQLLSFGVLGSIAFVAVVFLAGVALSFVSKQSADDLWNRLCANHKLTKQDFYALVVGCGSIGFLFDRAILTSGVISAMFKLSYAEFFGPKIFAQVVLIALMAITGIVMTFIASKSAGQLWKIYSPTCICR
jgi:tetrahydromethanopterin S-methyltransferase subunit C